MSQQRWLFGAWLAVVVGIIALVIAIGAANA
jgi:hypothetical protein